MLVEAFSRVEIYFEDGVCEIKCVCQGRTDTGPFEVTIGADVEPDELDACVARCFWVFRGLVKMAENADDPRWVPSDAVAFVLSMINATETGQDFDLLA